MLNQPNLTTNHFFLPEDQHLFDYDQIFAVSSMWVQLGMGDVEATYDLSVRGMPNNRNFLLFGGLEEIISAITNWNFTKDEVDYLLANNVVTPTMAEIMRKYRFSGDIWAMPEGTVFFPGEPVVRITGKIWEVNLFTFFLMNALTSNTIYLSKIVRSRLAAAGKIVLVTGPVTRAHSHESALKFGRAAYILGSPSTYMPAFARKYNLPMSLSNTKAYHAFIKSFPTEIEAMRAAASVFPRVGFMVDTYDFYQGVKNAITVALELRTSKPNAVSALVIDSGKDIHEFIKRTYYARRKLDDAGLHDINVVVTGNFEEKKIAQLVKAKAPAYSVIACTDLITSSDDPKLEAILKLVEYRKGGQTFQAAKLTTGKISYPGKKQVFRSHRNGRMTNDTIGLANESLGTPLLIEMIKAGKQTYDLPSLDTIKRYIDSQLEQLPPELQRIDKQFRYPVEYSKDLKMLLNEARKQHQQHVR